MTKINFKHHGFSVPELMIAAGISVLLVGGSAYTFKKFYQTQKQESTKSKSVEGITLAKQIISKDLSSALKIIGSTGSFFKPVSRPYDEATGNENDYNASDNDTLVILKELFGDIQGDMEITKNTTNTYDLFYRKDGSTKDTYFLKAFTNKTYFIITNAENRNIFKRISTIAANTKCPSDGAGTTNCHRITVRAGTVSSAVVVKDNEVSRIGSQVRVAEKIEYFINNGTLYRRTDNESDASKWKVILPDAESFQVKYDFKPIEGTGRKSTVELKANYSSLPLRIRSPKDSVYQSALTAANASSKGVTFDDVDRVEIKLSQNIRSLDPASVNIQGSTGFSVVNNVVTFASLLDQRPGENTGTDQLDAGIIIGICDIPEKARCNPACGYKYTSVETQYHYTSNLCKCGWDPVDGQFYDPFKFQNKIPKGYNSTVPAGATLTRKERIDACASHYDCLGGSSWVQGFHPGCRVVASCINNIKNTTPTTYKSLYARPVAYETLPEGGINVDLLKTYIEAASADDANATANAKIQCGINHSLYVSTCDSLYSSFAVNSGRSVGKKFADVCSCAVRDWDHNGNISSNPRDTHDINWSKICSTTPGNRCVNTWNSTAGSEGFKLRSTTNPQGLTYTMAGICSCSNLTPPPRPEPSPAAQWGPKNIYFFRDFRSKATASLTPPSLPAEVAQDTLGLGGGDLAANCMHPSGGTETSWTCGSSQSYIIPTAADLTTAGMLSFVVDGARQVTAPHLGVLNAWNPAAAVLAPLSNAQCVDMESQFIDERKSVGNDWYDAPSFCTVEGQLKMEVLPPGFSGAGITSAANLGASGPALWPYRFFCHPDCGMGAPQRDARYKKTDFIRERDYYRKKFIALGVPPSACRNQAEAGSPNPPEGGGTTTYTETGKSLGSP